MTHYVVTVTWYAPVMTILAAFLIVASVVFLASFRPRQQRNLVAVAMVVLAAGIIAHALVPLLRLWVVDLPPQLFASHAHAAGVVAPYGLDVAAVLILLTWVARERRARRPNAGGGSAWSIGRRLGQRRRGRRPAGRRTPPRRAPGRGDVAGFG